MIKFLLTAVVIYLIYRSIMPSRPKPEIRKPHENAGNYSNNIEGEYVDYEEVDE